MKAIFVFLVALLFLLQVQPPPQMAAAKPYAQVAEFYQTINIGSVPANGFVTRTFTTDPGQGDILPEGTIVDVGLPANTPFGVFPYARVTAQNTVTLGLRNFTGTNINAGTQDVFFFIRIPNPRE